MEPLTWKALAAKLETSLQSLHRWRQMDDAPIEPNLEAWQTFVKRQSESSPTIFGVPALKLVVFEAPSV